MKKDRLTQEIRAHALSSLGVQLSAAQVLAVLESLEMTVSNNLKAGNEVTLPGIGTIGTKQRAARTGRNLQTGAAIDIPAKTVVDFRATKALKDAINP